MHSGGGGALRSFVRYAHYAPQRPTPSNLESTLNKAFSCLDAPGRLRLAHAAYRPEKVVKLDAYLLGSHLFLIELPVIL